MNIKIVIPFAAAAVLLAGCATEPQVKRVSSADSPQMVSTMNKMDLQDWRDLSNEMVGLMLENGVFERAPKQPARIVVTRIRNETMSAQDIDILTNQILEALTNTGKVVASATYGKGAAVTDQGTREIQQERNSTNDLLDEMNGTYDDQTAAKKTVDRIPFFTLSGSIKQQSSQDKDVKQSVFILELRLAETESGDIVWRAQRPIVKQKARHSFGL